MKWVLEMDEKDGVLMMNAIAQLPWAQVNKLIHELEAQIQSQQTKAQQAAEAAVKKASLSLVDQAQPG